MMTHWNCCYHSLEAINLSYQILDDILNKFPRVLLMIRSLGLSCIWMRLASLSSGYLCKSNLFLSLKIKKSIFEKGTNYALNCAYRHMLQIQIIAGLRRRDTSFGICGIMVQRSRPDSQYKTCCSQIHFCTKYFFLQIYLLYWHYKRLVEE